VFYGGVNLFWRGNSRPGHHYSERAWAVAKSRASQALTRIPLFKLLFIIIKLESSYSELHRDLDVVNLLNLVLK
jgi:hypothetical protein